MDQDNQAEQLECFEFLDLSDVDDRERDQLATTLYARDEDSETADCGNGGDNNNNLNHSEDGGEDHQQQQQQQHQRGEGRREQKEWKKKAGSGSRTFSNSNNKKGRVLKYQPPADNRREYIFSTEDEESTNNGSVIDSRPVSRTESVLTDISSSCYLSGSASSLLHVPNNAHPYPASVTSPPLIINSAACNGGGGGGPNWAGESGTPATVSHGHPQQSPAYGGVTTAYPLQHPSHQPPTAHELYAIRQPPPSHQHQQHVASRGHHHHHQPPRHVNPTPPHPPLSSLSGPTLISAVPPSVAGQHEVLVTTGGGGGQLQQQHQQMFSGGAANGVGHTGFGGRAPGLPVIVSGGVPPHPHGPLIRGNLVPRLLAPLPGTQATGHQAPLYAIVKPQQATGPGAVVSQPVRPSLVPGVGVGVACVPVAITAGKLGSSVAAATPANVNSSNSSGELGLCVSGISFDSGNVSSATTGSSSGGGGSSSNSGRPGSESVDVTDADASTSSSTLTTSEIIERGVELGQQGDSIEPTPHHHHQHHHQQQQHHHHQQQQVSYQPEEYQKPVANYQSGEMSQQQQGGGGGGAASGQGNNANNHSNNHGPPPHQQQQQQGGMYQPQQHHGHHHYHGQPAQHQQQQTFVAQGGHMYHMLPPTLPSNVFVGNMTANVNVHGVMSHPFIPAAATSAVAAAAGSQPAFIEMAPQQQQQQQQQQPQQHQVAVTGGAANAGMIHGGGHEMPQVQQQHHQQSQGHMMGGGSRGLRRGRGRGGNNSSHRREYGGGGGIGGGGRMQQPHQGQGGHMQHIQSQQQQPHHHQQQVNVQHQQGGGPVGGVGGVGVGPQQQQVQNQQQQQQPEMMTQIIDQQQVMNPSGWYYYSPYPGYYNQIAGHHQAAAAAAAQHATGHPIYVQGPPMPMYGHHMVGGYPQGMFMYPAAAAANQGANAQGVPAGPAAAGPAGIVQAEYGYAESGKGSGFVVPGAAVVTGEEGQYEVIQGQQQQPQVVQPVEQQMMQPGVGVGQAVVSPTPVMWNQGQGGPVAIEYQEVVVSPHDQQLQQVEGVVDGYVAPEQQQQQQGYMDQQQQGGGVITGGPHTLNPNVANFMTLKQQQELNEQQQQQSHDHPAEQQQQQAMPVQMMVRQEMMVQTGGGGGYEHMQAPMQHQQLAYNMTGQPIVVNDQGEVAYIANMEGGMIVAGGGVDEYNQQQQPQIVHQVPLNAAEAMAQGGGGSVVDMGPADQQPINVVYTNMMSPSGGGGNNLNLNNSPKVPVVTTTPIVQNNNSNAPPAVVAVAGGNVNTVTALPQGQENVMVKDPAQQQGQENVPIVEQQQQQQQQSVDGYVATMVDEKLSIEGSSGGTGYNNNKTWAQQAATVSSAQVQQQPPHDSNNNVAGLPQLAVSAGQPAKKVVTTTSVAVTAAPERSPMISPKARHETAVVVNGNGEAAPKAESTMVQKANAILQTDVVPPQQQQQAKKLETNTVSVTATPAAINGGGGEKPTAAPAAPSAAPPSSWASLFASSQRAATVDSGSNGPVVGSKKPVAKVLPFEGTQVQAPTANVAGSMSYSAASSMGLASTTQSVAVTATATVVAQNNQLSEQDKSSMADRRRLKLGEFLSKYQIDNTNVSLNPRGLTNRSNYCYINAIVQALVACPPFYHVMKQIEKDAPGFKEKSTTPIIDAIVDLVNEFSPLTQAIRLNRREKGPKGKEEIELNCPPPFEPTVIHKILNSRGNGFKVEGRQEDAEEFLSYLLNGLNDEMLELIKMIEKPVQNGVEATNGEPPADEGDDWQVIVNNRNKGTVTRTTDFGRTPISDIFRGQVRSRLQREGDHSTDVIQPFFTLQLDIEKVSSVKEALEMLVVKDQLEGVTCTKTNQEVAAWQQYTLEKLPMVLILHLKLFDYTMSGCTKILKTVSFPIELKIDTKILSSKKYQAKQKMYKLIAVVYHDGKEASKGHYVTDVYNSAYSSWIRYDDSMVRPVKEHQVLHPKAPRAPYLLYYRRCDTIAGQPQQSGGGSTTADHQTSSSASSTAERSTTTTHSSGSGRSSIGGR